MGAVAGGVLAPVVLDELDQLIALGRVGSAQRAQRERGTGDDRRPGDLVGVGQRRCDLGHLGCVDPPQDGHGAVAVPSHGRLIRLPGEVARSLDRFLVRRLPALELRFAHDARLDHPVAHPGDAVVLDLEPKSLFRLVALVAAAGRVPLRLRELGDVKERRLLLLAHALDSAEVRLDQRRIVPAPDCVDVDAGAIVGDETSQHIGDRALRRLGRDGHRDAVAVVPDGQRHRYLQNPRRVHGLPEMSLARGRVADGAERDLVAVDREAVLRATKLRVVTVELRRVRQPEQARHPAGDVGDVRRRVGSLHRPREFAPIVDESRREVVSHLPPAGRGVGVEVRVAVQLGEERAHIRHARRPHEGLVAVVARAPVARTERFGHRELGDLFAVAEDSEGGVPAQDLGAPDDAGTAAGVGEAVVGADGLGGQVELGVAERFGHLER